MWAELREAQDHTARTVRDCGLAVGIDIGDADDIHPTNKQEAGRRLALLALARDYGRAAADSGPVYDWMSIEGSAVRIHFKNNDGLGSKDGQPLQKFSISGADGMFVWADAQIDKGTVVVSSPKVPEPKAVRYAWAQNPEGANLTNACGLPAGPFRTDEP